MIINRKSFHYKLASFGEVYTVEHTVDNLCEYIRCIIRGCFRILIGIAVILCFGAGFIYPIIWAFTGFDYIFAKDNIPMITTGIVEYLVILFSIAMFLYTKYRTIPKYDKEPGFITNTYKAIKEKTCFKLDFY